MAGSHVLLSRAALDPKISFDLHVLGMPPAFILSQDQTLKLNGLINKLISLLFSAQDPWHIYMYSTCELA